MKKAIAVLLSLLTLLAFAACTQEPEEPTVSQDERIAQANEAAGKLLSYKAELDPQLTVINSADNNDTFFDLTGMQQAGAAFSTLLSELNGDTALLTDGEEAKAAAEQVDAIVEKVNTAAGKYYDQFVLTYPDAKIAKIYCLTLFMNGEPSSFFAADYTDADGTEKTVYSISSFTAETPADVLASVTANLFKENPVASRNPKQDGNLHIDLDALKAAATPSETATATVTESATEAATEAVTEAATEAATETVTEAETEVVTETVTETATDAATEAAE